jgi:hypothetical protein
VLSLTSLSPLLLTLVPRNLTPLQSLGEPAQVIHQVKDAKDLQTPQQLFLRIVELAKEAKARDLVWLAAVASIAELAPFIRSGRPVEEWPNLLRNAIAHGQIFTDDATVTAFNSRDPKRADWVLTAPKEAMKAAYNKFFSRIHKLICASKACTVYGGDSTGAEAANAE